MSKVSKDLDSRPSPVRSGSLGSLHSQPESQKKRDDGSRNSIDSPSEALFDNKASHLSSAAKESAEHKMSSGAASSAPEGKKRSNVIAWVFGEDCIVKTSPLLQDGSFSLPAAGPGAVSAQSSSASRAIANHSASSDRPARKLVKIDSHAAKSLDSRSHR